MKSSIPCYLLSILLLAASCVLDLNEENFVKVDNTPDTSLVGDLEYTYGGYKVPYYPVRDTVWLEESVLLRFNNGKVMFCDVLIDGDTVMQKIDPSFLLEKGEREWGISFNV